MKSVLALLLLGAVLLCGTEGKKFQYYGEWRETCWERDTTVTITKGSRFWSGDGGTNYPDPYAIVQIGKQSYRTQSLTNNPNPVWKKTFKFKKAGDYRLIIKVYDSDPWIARPDEYLTTVTKYMWYPKGKSTPNFHNLKFTWSCE